MTSKVDRGWGRVALLVAHCAGLVDLAALPVWMDVLIDGYRLGPQRAGALVSLFLFAGVASSMVMAPRFLRQSARLSAVAGYATAAIAFACSAVTTQYPWLCVLYLIGGAAVGCGLSFTHGTVGRSANPHRLFALAGTAFGVFAIGFFSLEPALVARFGPAALFWLFAGVMAFAALVCLAAFPATATAQGPASSAVGGRLQTSVWFAFVGVGAMALNQALTASFLQRVGLDHGFGAAHVNAVLVALAFVTLLPAPLAALTQRYVSARAVVVAGPLVQMAVSLAITQGTELWVYAIAGSLLTSVQIFVHTYAFGLIARIDRTGRAVAATPAMLMTGSAIGPVLSGVLVGGYGYPSLGIAAIVIGAIGAASYHRATAGEKLAPVLTRRTAESLG